MPTLGERLFEAEKIDERIGKVLGNPYTDERRLTLPLAYVDLSLDHHRAIVLLMRRGPARFGNGTCPCDSRSDDSITNYEKLTFFQQAKQEAWPAMNSCTHSGLLQLARQFSVAAWKLSIP